MGKGPGARSGTEVDRRPPMAAVAVAGLVAVTSAAAAAVPGIRAERAGISLLDRPWRLARAVDFRAGWLGAGCSGACVVGRRADGGAEWWVGVVCV